MSNGSRIEGLVQRVPHVWYDIIGRLIPGAFLLGGLIDAGGFPPIVNRFRHYVQPDPIVGLTIGFSVFIGVAFAVGFLLAATSGLLESVWSTLRPFTLDQPLFSATRPQLEGKYGIVSISDKTKGRNGSDERKQSDQIGRARNAILNILWTYPDGAAIAELTSKRDAEKLASSSIAFAALILLASNIGAGKCWRGPCSFVAAPSLVVLSVVALLATKRIPEKFVRSAFVIASVVMVVRSIRLADTGRCWLLLAIILASLACYGHYRERCLETPLGVIEDIQKRGNTGQSSPQ